MKNHTKIICVLSLAILATSCRKDDEEIVAPTKTYLSKETLANIGSYTYNYDTQNKLASQQFTSLNETSNPSYTLTIKTYEGDKIKTMLYDINNPTKQDYDIVNTYDSSGRLTTQIYYLVNTSTLSFRYQIEYPTNLQQIVKRFNDLNEIYSTDVYNFDAARKNVIEYKRYGFDNALVYTYSYSSYGDKINSKTLVPAGFSTNVDSQNNYLSLIYTPATGAATTYNYTYENNPDNYITKRTAPSGSFNTYEYVKK